MSNTDYGSHDGDEQDSPIETTPATTVDDAGDDSDAEVVDDAGGVFMPTREDGRLLPVERESDLFREPIEVNPTNQRLYDQYIKGKDDIRELTYAEWADYIADILVTPDPEEYARMYGKSGVDETFIEENVGGDQRREIAALSLEAGGFSAAAANARGEMTDQEKENLKLMLESDEVDLENLAEQQRTDGT